jgi:hypothetical protein
MITPIIKHIKSIQPPYPILRIPSWHAPGSIPELAIVMCHWGQSPAQVKASQDGLQAMLAMVPSAHIVFVEAQFPGDPPRIDTADPGITRVDIALGELQRGMFLKEALWNVGARRALLGPAVTKLLFIDADCTYCHQGALQSVSKTLDDCDVCSAHAYSYYVDQPDLPGLQRSVCWAWLRDGKADGHAGFTVGMTREFFDRIGGFPVITTVAGDTWFWFRVFGKRRRTFTSWNAPHNYGNIEAYGLFPFPRIGATVEAIFHRPHGTMKNRLYGARRVISRATTNRLFDDRRINAQGLPEWLDTPGARLARQCQLRLSQAVADDSIGAYPNATARRIYDRLAEQEYGAIDADHPLVIATSFRGGGPYTHRHVTMLRDLFATYCKTPHSFLCVTDDDIEGVDCRPFVSSAAVTPYYYCQLELFRSDLYPPNASVLTCDLDAIPVKDFTMHRAPSGSMAMGMELHNWSLSNRTVWNGGVCYFRGDYGHILDDYIAEFASKGSDHPWFTFISSQEYAAGNLYKHGKRIDDLLAHLSFEFYDGKNYSPRAETAFVHFLWQPKPWGINPRPDWLPEIAHTAGGAGAYQTAQA